MSSVPSFEGAEQRKELGMQRAIENADREYDWSGAACEMVMKYAETHDGFLIEDARAWAEGQGLPDPPTKRAWGPVANNLRRTGKLEACGAGKAKSSNNTLKTKWRRAAA